MPALSLNISSAKCWAEPPPAEAKLIRPGFCLHRATRSFTVLAGWSVLQISKFGVTPTMLMGTKSFSAL
jgi:hypothetical protein